MFCLLIDPAECKTLLVCTHRLSDANEVNSKAALKRRLTLQRLFERYKLGEVADPADSCRGTCYSQYSCSGKDGCAGWYCDMNSNQ